MSQNSPLFSVVIPTRNRAHLLQHALQSALHQTFDDYEIVVSDNYSQDGTAQVVKELSDSRVRYVRTDKPLSMPDSWEFALEHARGRYVTYLSDDDAMRPSLLARLNPILMEAPGASIGWRHGIYYHPDWPAGNERRKLSLHPNTESIKEIPSSLALEEMFALTYSDHFPRLLNSCCSRSFLSERKQRMGKLFHPTCPDYSAAVATLTGMENIFFIGEPLIVCGLAGASNGSYGFEGTNAIQTFMSEFSNLEEIWSIPLSSPTPYNQIAVTLIGLKRVLGKELAPYSLSTVNLFARDYEEIGRMGARGADVQEARREWEEALSAQSVEVQQATRGIVSQVNSQLMFPMSATPEPASHNLKSSVKTRFPTLTRVLSTVRSTVFTKDRARGQSDKGNLEREFDNIFEAAKALDRVY